MASTLVIGGSGPTGPFIVNGLIERGHQVTVLHRGTHEVQYAREIEHIHTDPHFAEPLAAALRGRSFDTVVATYGRLRLLPEILRGKTRRLVTVGGATYRSIESRPAGESAPRATGKLYDKIVEAEQVLFEGHAKGWYSLTHLRYPYIYGPRQLAPIEWSIIRRLRDGRRRLLAVDGGLMLRAAAYVENAAHAVLLAVDKPQPAHGEAFNVAEDFAFSDGDRIRRIAELMRVPMEVVSIPAKAGLPGYYPGTSRSLRVEGAGEPRSEHDLISNAKIVRLLGYADLVERDEAMRRTVQWYLDHPFPAGGEDEQRLGDTFNYAAEDRLLAEYDAALLRLDAASLGGQHRHAYDHPKQAPK